MAFGYPRCSQSSDASGSRFTPPSRLSVLCCAARLRDMALNYLLLCTVGFLGTPFCQAEHRRCCRKRTLACLRRSRVSSVPAAARSARKPEGPGQSGVPFLFGSFALGKQRKRINILEIKYNYLLQILPNRNIKYSLPALDGSHPGTPIMLFCNLSYNCQTKARPFFCRP